jgi:hypothetical protein
MNEEGKRTMKERRYFLIMNRIKENLINSKNFIDTLLTPEKDLIKNLGGEFDQDELIYTLRYLVRKGYLANYDGNEYNYDQLKLTVKGFDDWLFPRGAINHKKIFFSHADEDKKQAGELKKELEKDGFVVFLAHEDISGTEEFRDKMISELETCGIFISFRTEKYCGKSYTEQECGFALAMGKRILSLFVGTKPDSSGFCSALQGKKFKKDEEIIKIAEYCKKQLVNLNSNF